MRHVVSAVYIKTVRGFLLRDAKPGEKLNVCAEADAVIGYLVDHVVVCSEAVFLGVRLTLRV